MHLWKTTIAALALTAMLGAMMGIQQSAHAQVALTLTPAVTTTTVGSTVTFTLNLVGGSNVGEYNTYVTFDPRCLSPVNLNTDGIAADDYYYTSTNPAFTFELANTAATGGAGTLKTFQISAGVSRSGVTPAGSVVLGTFGMVVVGAPGVSGTSVSLSSVTGTGGANNGYSDVLDNTTLANELTLVTGGLVFGPVSAPEPSGGVALLVGAGMMMGMGAAGWKIKKRTVGL